MIVKITEGPKATKSIVAESENFCARLNPVYDEPTASTLIVDGSTYAIVVTGKGVDLRSDGNILCRATEQRRTPKNTQRRKILFIWEESVLEFRQLMDGYKIVNKSGKKVGKASKQAITVRDLKGALTINQDVDKVTLAFISTLIGHLWKSDLQTHKIKHLGGLTLLANEPEPTSKESIIGGLIFVALGIYGYYYFTELEGSGRTGETFWLVALLYNLGGKFLVSGLSILFGLAILWGGYCLRKKESEQVAASDR